MTVTFGSLFAGIGGLDLGLERAGMRCAWQVEIDPFCRRVLAKHWPDVQRFEDVKDVGRDSLPAVDLIAGGFPCQPYSSAGKQRGAEDDRNLWPEYRRIVAELRPRYVLAENVLGIVSTYLDTVLSDMEQLGYTWGAFDIPAVAFNAPHRRERIFVVAYTTGDRRDGGQRKDEYKRQHDPMGRDQQLVGNGSNRVMACAGHAGHWDAEPAVGRVADGVPRRVDRLRALGSAVLPQVAEWIGRRIVAIEEAITQ